MKHLCLLALLYCFALLEAQNFDDFQPMFENIDVEVGLSNYNVSDICQDSMGYLWVATSRGLNRYDGQTFKTFLFNPNTPYDGLPHDMLSSVYYCKHHIFVRTRKGIAVLNQKTDKWTNIFSQGPIYGICVIDDTVLISFNNNMYYYDFKNECVELFSSFQDAEVCWFVESDDEFIWTLTSGFKKLICFDKNFEVRRTIPLNGLRVSTMPVIFNKQFFLHSEDRLLVFDIVEEELQPNVVTPFHDIGLIPVHSMRVINAHMLGVITMGEGMYVYDVDKNIVQHIHKDDGKSSLSTNMLKCLFIDRSGNTWVGTFDKGLDVFYKKQNEFNSSRDLNLMLKDDFINFIINDRYSDVMLFGSRTNGLLSQPSAEITRLNAVLKDLGMECVISIYEDSEYKLWIGGTDRFIVYDQVTQKVEFVSPYLRFQHIENIVENEGQIFLVSERRGIYVFDLDVREVAHFARGEYGINQLLFANDSTIYYCNIVSGLSVVDLSSGKVDKLQLKKDGLPFEWEGAVCMKQQSDSIVWVGTLSWGLIKVNLFTLECKCYCMDDGLPANDITAIEFDEQSRLWLSTSEGLSCMLKDGVFYNFSSHEGIGNFQFHRRSSYKSEANGIIYFGGNDGITYFDPSTIVLEKAYNGGVVLEGLYANGVEINSQDSTGILNRHLTFSESITLSHKHSDFSIRYTSPEMYAHDRIQFSHFLEGWDKTWRNVDDVHQVEYANLPPGDYTFFVRARRSSGLWSEQKRLDIRIDPAPWLSWWAYSLYLILFLVITYFLLYLYLHSRMVDQDLKAEQREHNRENEVNEMKHRFFTNISHELRTPISIIHSISNMPERELYSQEQVQFFLRNLRLNTERLKRLVDQFLTFRNLERDTLELDVSSENLDDVIQGITEPFNLFTAQKKIHFSVSCLLEEWAYFVDRDKVEKIINNLLDNAIKYTPQGGFVGLSVGILQGDHLPEEANLSILEHNDTDEFLHIQISDSGIGIDSSDLPHIFDRYYKVSGNSDYSGTGIGLNFVKRLVEIYKGVIYADSVKDEGTVFSIILPIKRDVKLASKPLDSGGVPVIGDVKDATLLERLPSVAQRFKDKKILIVEDDIPLNSFLTESYSSAFKVYSAFNSKEALILAKNVLPDLIISDVMMIAPDEGLKFCMRIKEDAYLSHIPVILLTAKAEKNQIAEGYSCGADAYVLKPFDINLLTKQVVALIENRERLQTLLFDVEMPKANPKETYNQEDIVFLKKINAVIEQEYSNPDFNVALLSKELLISRSAFYRKFTQITELTPFDYLKKYRIAKAIELMEEDKYSISQVIEMAGFNSRSGFYASFKSEKGMTPSEYLKQS